MSAGGFEIRSDIDQEDTLPFLRFLFLPSPHPGDRTASSGAFQTTDEEQKGR